MIERFLQTKSEPSKSLGVKILVIGSVVEGTRIGPVNEADCFLQMDKLKPTHFELVGSSATEYKVMEAGKSLLPKDFIDDKGNLDYFVFLRSLLSELLRFFREESQPDGSLHESGMTAKFEFKMCESCRKEKGPVGHLMHCQNCRPAITFTKAGPCGIFEDKGSVISIDLIPLLPCQKPKPVEMFNRVTSALVKEELPNWLPYLEKFVRSDGLLPEVLGASEDQGDGFIAMKILHAQSDKNNFILRPGQKLAMANLQEPKLKESYCYLKALKTVMTLGLSSFSLKKVLLLEDFTRKAATAKDVVDILYSAINHQHLKPFFEDHEFRVRDRRGEFKIDFEAWQEQLREGKERNRIPLKWRR